MKKIYFFVSATVLAVSVSAQLPCSVAGLVTSRLICPGSTVQIGPSPHWTYIYSWSPTTGLDNPDAARPNATPSATTTYTVTVSGLGCTTSTASVTVNVPEVNLVMKVTGSDGDITIAPAQIDYYYWYENSDNLTFISNSPIANVWYDNGTISGTGTTYTIPYTGLNNTTHGVQLRIRDDQNNECPTNFAGSFLVSTVRGYGCNNISQFPPGTHQNWYCASALPATIYQANMGASGEYHWGFPQNPTDWAYSNISGNSAQINVPNPSGCPDPLYCASRGGLYMRALQYTNAYGDPYPWQEVRVNYGVGRDAGCRTKQPQSPKAPDIYVSPHPAPLLPLPGQKMNLPTVQQNLESISVTVIPNPANQMVKLIARDEILQINIYDLNGKLLKQIPGFRSKISDVITKEFLNGMYIFSIQTTRERISKTILIQR